MKVLVIPEDPTYNGYILRPLVKRLLAEIGKPNADVTVMTNPRAQGYPMIKDLLPEIAERYKHVDLLLFMPDRDCRNKSVELLELEKSAAERGAKLLTCAAEQELEAWLLAGHVEKLPESWSVIRQECSLKEVYFEPFMREYGDNGAGEGRERLMRETLRHYDSLLARCPELHSLQNRISSAIG